MKFIKGYFAINFLALVFVGIVQYIKTFQLENLVSSAFCLFISILLFRSLLKKKTTKNSNKKCSNSLEKKDDLLESTITQSTENESPEAYIETENVIYRTDERPASDEEVPYLVQTGYEKRVSEEQNNKNPKFHRTEREEDLSCSFMTKYGAQVNTLTEDFETAYRNSFSTFDIDEKILLLNEAKKAFEKAKRFCYSKGKGGTIYFQDMWEYMHNSQNECFSYLNNIEDSLEECTFQRDVVIPKIIDIIIHTSGILQKDIYKLLPDIDKSTVQRTLKYLENKNKISREKKKNSYELHIKE